MTKKLSVVFCVVALAGPVASAAAQSPPMEITTAAPSSLVCDQTGTATVTIQTRPAPFELMLVIDESGSITSSDFIRLKNFMIDLVVSLRFGANQTRVGVVMFGSTARLITGLNASQAAVVNVVNSIQQRGGGTCIGCGIALADQQLQANGRPGVPRFMFVLTDGRNNTGTDTFASVIAAAKGNGTTLFAVGVAEAILSELQQIASTIPGTETTFFAANFTTLPLLLGSVTSVLPSTTVRNARLQLTMSPEFTPLALRPDQRTESTAAISGNAIDWAIPLPFTPMELAIDFRRAGSITGSAQLFRSFAYQEDDGREGVFQNATVSIAGCDTAAVETEIESLQRQVTELTARVSGLADEVAGLTSANQALLEQIAALQQENDELRRQLSGQPVAPTGTGAMSGSGQVVAGRLRNAFELWVSKAADGNLKLALAFKVCEQLPNQADDDLTCLNRIHRLAVSYFTAVQFSDDPTFGPAGDAATAGVDTLTLSGVGSWDGVPDHRFSVTATDRTDAPGPNTDTFQIEITSPDGTVVATVLGTVAAGSLEVR